MTQVVDGVQQQLPQRHQAGFAVDGGALPGVGGDQPERAGHLSPGDGHEVEFFVPGRVPGSAAAPGNGSHRHRGASGRSIATVRFMRSAKNCSQSAMWQTTSSVLHLPATGRERSCSTVIPATAAAVLPRLVS